MTLDEYRAKYKLRRLWMQSIKSKKRKANKARGPTWKKTAQTSLTMYTKLKSDLTATRLPVHSAVYGNNVQTYTEKFSPRK